MLRAKDIKGVLHKLLEIKNFNKVIVNAVEYTDIKVFLIALSESINRGKNYLFRTAASFVQVIGGINPKPLLTKETLYPKGKPSMPGLIIIGSYVQKTTRQMKKLAELSNLIWVEWDVSQAKTQECLRAEVDRVASEVKKGFNSKRMFVFILHGSIIEAILKIKIMIKTLFFHLVFQMV